MDSRFEPDLIDKFPELGQLMDYVPDRAGSKAVEEVKAPTVAVRSYNSMVDTAHSALLAANLMVNRDTVSRFIASLLAKRFVILTGLAGSGKTKLAQCLSSWLTSEDSGYVVVPVGADWTSSDPILGYPDALNRSKYIRTPALTLILNALSNPGTPHFLILDEMNLSHVERYFAPILSAMESGECIHLHDGVAEGADLSVSVPRQIEVFPKNLFVVGTVNIDETTYLFSPKVLDRANVIEFRVSSSDLAVFMESPTKIDLGRIASSGADFADKFLARATSDVYPTAEVAAKLRIELRMFFDVMYRHGSEFGYRTAFEIGRFVAYSEEFAQQGESLDSAIDSQILQKLLPRIHGARREIEPLLRALGGLCYIEREWIGANENITLANESEVRGRARQASMDEDHNPSRKREDGSFAFQLVDAWHPKSFDKIQRMLVSAEAHGFASYAAA